MSHGAGSSTIIGGDNMTSEATNAGSATSM
jgi:hypothetical protein